MDKYLGAGKWGVKKIVGHRPLRGCSKAIALLYPVYNRS